MHSLLARCVRATGVAALLALSAAVPARAAQDPVAVPPVAPLTERDVAASNAKIASAYHALVNMWTADFRDIGVRFAAPSLSRYRGSAYTSCGPMPRDNAIYCPQRNAIFFDEVFIARQARNAAQQLGTDGDMVAVGIIAHEMGHAVAMQLGEESPVPYRNEQTADCLAGAFTQRAAEDGSLEPGDLEEAFFGMAAAGDPTPQLTNNRRVNQRIVYRAAVMGHGTREQRMANFNAGYEGGAGACLQSFQS